MIGNLIFSIGVALLSASVVVAGDVRAQEVKNTFTEYNATSHINGDNVVNYMSLEREFSTYAVPSQDTTYIQSYDDNGNLVISDTRQINIDTTLNTLTLANTLDDTKIWLLSRRDSSNYVLGRLLVPSSYSQIFNIEFSITGNFNYGTFSVSLFKNTTSNYTTYPLTTESNLLWYGFSRDQVNVNTTSFDSGTDGFEFYDFGFKYQIESGYSYRMHFDFLGVYSQSSFYSQAYNVGYNAGFQDGAKDGYAKGYADCLALVQNNGDFSSLFNSVADTPLRFLYGLFSFDLFGTSILVIILTLLTGIAVFGIIKKVWK